jgi:diguanylate cyclase (GGDEF)-like protein
MSAKSAVVSHRPLLLAACVSVLTTVVLLPLSHHQLGPTVSFMPALISVVGCFDLLSVYLLLGDYLDRGDRRLLVMAWAYAFSLTVMGGYALAFPGAVSMDPPLAVSASIAPYTYIAWHAGFPMLLGLAWAPWPARWTRQPTRGGSRVVAIGSTAAALAGGVLVVALLLLLAEQMPVLINGVDTSAMTTVTGPIVLPLVALALVVCVHGTWRRVGAERWASIAVLVCLCDLVLTYWARSRFSVGWYAGRTLTLVAAAVLLLAMLVAFRRLTASAEHDAAHDPLTGLANRRSAYDSLDQLMARACRSGSPLGVLSIDLDHFKQINDHYGHHIGDLVLTEVSTLFARSFRLGDIVARVGGEEFLVLLPDTDEAGTLAAAEKVRIATADLQIPFAGPITASLGATVLAWDDPDSACMLQRLDAALYAAKAQGRNRVVTAPIAGGPGIPAQASRPKRVTPVSRTR